MLAGSGDDSVVVAGDCSGSGSGSVVVVVVKVGSVFGSGFGSAVVVRTGPGSVVVVVVRIGSGFGSVGFGFGFCSVDLSGVVGRAVVLDVAVSGVVCVFFSWF